MNYFFLLLLFQQKIQHLVFRFISDAIEGLYHFFLWLMYNPLWQVLWHRYQRDRKWTWSSWLPTPARPAVRIRWGRRRPGASFWREICSLMTFIIIGIKMDSDGWVEIRGGSCRRSLFFGWGAVWRLTGWRSVGCEAGAALTEGFLCRSWILFLGLWKAELRDCQVCRNLMDWIFIQLCSPCNWYWELVSNYPEWFPSSRYLLCLDLCRFFH